MEKERGEASIFIELKDGDITVYHGTEGQNREGRGNGKAILKEIKNAKAGSWDKIWKVLEDLK